MAETGPVKDKLYGRFQLNRPGFSLDAEIHIPAKGITGLFGDSGCGKTTLLRCLAGLERADSGFLQVAGKPWQDESKGIFLKSYERPIGLVFQEARLFPHMTVEQNLLYGVRRKRGLKRKPSEFTHILDLLGVEHLLNRKPERLSGGEMQRVAIGRALLTRPELLLMDEPLAALDNRRKREIMPFLDRLHEELEIPVIYVTHSPEELIHLADRMIHLQQGRVSGMGEVVEILAQMSVNEGVLAGSDNQFEVVVRERDEQSSVILVDTPIGEVYLPLNDAQVGEHLSMQISRHDILLSDDPQAGNRLLNNLQARVEGIEPLEVGCVQITLGIAKTILKVKISQKSFNASPLVVGQSIFAGFNKAYLGNINLVYGINKI